MQIVIKTKHMNFIQKDLHLKFNQFSLDSVVAGHLVPHAVLSTRRAIGKVTRTKEHADNVSF